MRTNTALLGAAAFAVGALSSARAQNVYSVNVVGYVNVTIPSGYSEIANPLLASDNSISNLFYTTSTTGGNPALACTAYTWNGSGFSPNPNDPYGYPPSGTGWLNASLQLTPGVGFLVNNTGPAFTNTFVGTVSQGNQTNTLAVGYNLIGSMWPQTGYIQDLGLTSTPGDTVYLFHSGALTPIPLDPYGYPPNGNGWLTSVPFPVDQVKGPQLPVGGSMLYLNSGTTPNKWIQTFTVQ